MAGDALWPYVTLSWDPQGANGATMNQNDNRGNYIYAWAGTPATSTTWAAVGGSSAWYNGSARSLCSYNAGWNFGAGDFEINFWMYQVARTSPWACLFGFGHDSPAQGWRILIGTTGQVNFNAHQGGGFASVDLNLVPLNIATHLALGRYNGVEFLYKNGVEVPLTGTAGNINAYSGGLQVSGTIGNNWLYTGHLDRIEILKGAVRHTAAFTPETSTFLPYAGQVSGVIRDSTGAACARTVRAFRRDTGALVSSTTSDAGTGAYSMNLPTLDELNIVAYDDAAGTFQNDIIHRVIPA